MSLFLANEKVQNNVLGEIFIIVQSLTEFSKIKLKCWKLIENLIEVEEKKLNVVGRKKNGKHSFFENAIKPLKFLFMKSSTSLICIFINEILLHNSKFKMTANYHFGKQYSCIKIKWRSRIIIQIYARDLFLDLYMLAINEYI